MTLSPWGTRPELRFGLFLPPFHHPLQNPTRALRRDIELIVLAEQLGFDEAWVGEHHSGGHEIIGGNDVFIAAAAERTSRIRLGTGVVSLPFHHPLAVADRAVLLDHLTLGRTMLGVGPGSLPMDAVMMGLDVLQQRRMMEESLSAIVALLASEEPVTMKTDWFTLYDASLQLRPYSQPCFEIAVAAAESPAGPSLAGRHGASLLSLGANTKGGFGALSGHWEIMEEQAATYGKEISRQKWRCVGAVHLAESAEQAGRDVRHGLLPFFDYVTRVTGRSLSGPAGGLDFEFPSPDEVSVDVLVQAINLSGFGVVGTAESAIAAIEALVDASGGFGTFLLICHDWANPEATRRSLEIFASEVMPVFQAASRAPFDAQERSAARRPAFLELAKASVQRASDDYVVARSHLTPSTDGQQEETNAAL